MMLLIRWLVTTLAILLVSKVVPGVHVDSLGTAVAAAAVLGVLNFAVRPILVFLTLPLTVVTLGFFLIIINAAMFELAGAIVKGMHVKTFTAALIASVIVSVVTWAMHLGGGGGGPVIVTKTWTGGVGRGPGSARAHPRPQVKKDDDVIDV